MAKRTPVTAIADSFSVPQPVAPRRRPRDEKPLLVDIIEESSEAPSTKPAEMVFFGAGPAIRPQQLRKAVAAVHMRAITGTYSHFSRRVFNGLLALACRAWNGLAPEQQGEVFDKRITPRFQANVGDLRTMLNVQKSDHGNDRFYEAIDALYRMEFRFDVMEDHGTEFQVASRLISQWGRQKVGHGVIEWEYPPDVFQMLMRPMPFAMIDMQLANSLNSGYALALYENTCRYVNNPAKLTRRLPVEAWMDLIAGSRERYNGEYRYFKRYCINPSLSELEASEACPIQLTLIETRGPKNRITHLQFQVELKKQLQLPTEMGRGPDPRLTQELRNLGVHERTINKLAIAMEEPDLRRHYDATRARMNKGTVANGAAYFVEICNRELELMQKRAADAAEAGPRLQLEPLALVEPATPDPQEAFTRLRVARLRSYFEELSELQKSELLDTFLEHDSAVETVRRELAKSGLKSKSAAGTFFWWLATVHDGGGLLTLPEELTLGNYIQWNQGAFADS